MISLVAICDHCVTLVQAESRPAALFRCDRCEGYACNEMMTDSDGKQVCLRCFGVRSK